MCMNLKETKTAGWGLASTAMTGEVLRSNAPAKFTSKAIGQKIPYAGERNVITVTLATNVEFRTEVNP